MKTDAFRKSWIAGAGLAAVFLAAGLTTAEARMISDDPAKAHAEQSRDAGEVITDGWITTKVKSKLLANTDVSGLDITVETRDYVVHLSGEVESQAQFDIAVQLATETEGVVEVDASGLVIVPAD
jgi:osmotically-inducible protein OsmY